MQVVHIGDGAVIGACSVVTKDVPSYAVVAGNPAQVKRMRFKQETIERFQAAAWWKFPFWDLGKLPVADPEQFISGVEKRVASGIAPYSPGIIDLKRIL